MFSASSFTPTYSGPIAATGETSRRTRTAAMQQANFAGNQRAFLNPMKGVQAGTANQQYRSGLAADTERAGSFGEAQQALASDYLTNAQANLAYGQNQAQEAATLRDLLLGQNRVDQNSMLGNRDLDISQMLAQRQREVKAKAADYDRRASIGGILTGLFGM